MMVTAAARPWQLWAIVVFFLVGIAGLPAGRTLAVLD